MQAGEAVWSFDGVNDYMNLDGLAALLVNTNNTKGTIRWYGQIHDMSASFYLWSFGNTNGNNEYIRINGRIDGKLQVTLTVAGTFQWDFTTDDTYVVDKYCSTTVPSPPPKY
jgi:hypothetical protein